MSYYENVKRAGAALVRGEDANWELARLTYENTIDGGGPPTGGRLPMDTWCRDVRENADRDFSKRTGERYRLMWERHGLTSPHGAKLPSWSETYRTLRDEEGDPPDRYGEWAASTVLNQASVQTQAHLVVQLLDNPAVLEVAKTAVLGAATTLYHQREKTVRTRWRRNEADERLLDELEGLANADKIERAVDKFTLQVARIGKRLVTLLPKGRPQQSAFVTLKAAVRDARETLDEVERWMEGGASDVDSFVRSVLKKG